MRPGKDVSDIAEKIRAASASTEARFLDIGARLEASVDTVAMLTSTFETLSNELKGTSLQQAARDLSQIATRVSAVAKAMGSELGPFGTLTELTGTIQARVAHMGKAVQGVGMLATNAKIAAAHIGDSSEDFISFATEINRTLRLAQTSLDEFAAELAGVGGRLQGAIASQSAIEAQQSKAVSAIPLRLAQSLDTLAARSDKAAATAKAVGEGSQHVGKCIGDVVMALQIGDITRQRIEHVDYGLGLLDEVLGPMAGQRQAGQGEWPLLTDVQHQALLSFCYRLQSAQLADTAEEFDHEIRGVLASLQALAADAREILRLGTDTFGGSGQRHGTFLGDLREEVGEVEALLTGFRMARERAEEVAASVSDATTRLMGHISTVRSLEADIRIMGLNTTLKCGRLGVVGRPLAIIAQELRLYANEIEADASEVMTALDQIVTIAGEVTVRARDGRTADIESIAAIMTRSLSQLGDGEQRQTDAFATLGRDGRTVAALLQDVVGRTAVQEEIAGVLRQAAADLAGIAPVSGNALEDASPQANRLIELFQQSYTMNRERTVLAHHAPGRSPQTGAAGALPQAATAAASDIDDIFF
jgi:hypothetical protein